MKTPIQIVAEAAQGFEGRPDLAVLLVRAAAEGGSDLVKFQLVYADELAVPAYQYFNLFRMLEMPDAAWRDVAREAVKRGVQLAFDVYGARSLELALSLGASALKIHSTDFFNDELVDEALATDKDVWFSIGGITLDEVRAFLSAHPVRRPQQLTLLFGFQAEPTATADNHLARLAALRKEFATLRLGFMDHAEGASEAARWLGVLSVPYGVSVLEKHITLGRRLGLEDSVSALDAADFRQYVDRVRAAEQAIGNAALETTEVEQRYRRRALKVVVATRALSAGQTLDRASVTLLRTPLPDGVTPLNRLDQVIGATLRRSVAAGGVVLREDLA